MVQEHHRKPDFFIVGAPKCGTTTLYSWLKNHPQIFMPEGKEPHFFAQHLSDRYCRVRKKEDYLDLFSQANSNQVRGEASVLYAFFPETIENILTFNPDAKMIFMLRYPVDMAVSYHSQLLVNLEEDEQDFEQCWHLQEDRRKGNHIPPSCKDPDLLQYRDQCALGRHLQSFIDIVPPDQRLILLLDDMADDPKSIYHQVLQFLDVADDGRTDFKSENESAVLRSRLLQKWIQNPPAFIRFIKPILKKFAPSNFWHKINRKKRTKKMLSPSFKSNLNEIFEPDIQIIETITQRDLSHWR